MAKKTFQERIVEEGNKMIQLHISDNVKKIVKQRDCKHDWIIVDSSEWNETWKCSKCNKYTYL